MEYKIFGCRLNKYFANQWIDYFEQNNMINQNTVLISSCEVTDNSKSKRIKKIRSYARKNYRIYLAGCWSIQYGSLIDEEKFYERYPELFDYKNHITLLPESPYKDYDYNPSKNIFTRKYILIQNGCDTYCSFCLTVKKRWSSRNISLENILEKAKNAEKQGINEIVLTWTNLTAWWATNTRNPEESGFSFLLERLLKETNIPRIRISSLSPEFLDEKFFELAKESRIMPFFHLSIQHFSPDILAAMNRNYTTEYLERVLKKFSFLKRKDWIPVRLGGDVIVGFPWEQKEDFELLYQKIKEYWISNLHVFSFSSHVRGETVPASGFDYKVSSEIKKEREKSLKELVSELEEDFVSLNKSKKLTILVENKDSWNSWGWSENYIRLWVSWVYKKWELVETYLD